MRRTPKRTRASAIVPSLLWRGRPVALTMSTSRCCRLLLLNERRQFVGLNSQLSGHVAAARSPSDQPRVLEPGARCQLHLRGRLKLKSVTQGPIKPHQLPILAHGCDVSRCKHAKTRLYVHSLPAEQAVEALQASQCARRARVVRCRAPLASRQQAPWDRHVAVQRQVAANAQHERQSEKKRRDHPSMGGRRVL